MNYKPKEIMFTKKLTLVLLAGLGMQSFAMQQQPRKRHMYTQEELLWYKPRPAHIAIDVKPEPAITHQYNRNNSQCKIPFVASVLLLASGFTIGSLQSGDYDPYTKCLGLSLFCLGAGECCDECEEYC
jgi:hypothetical protein